MVSLAANMIPALRIKAAAKIVIVAFILLLFFDVDEAKIHQPAGAVHMESAEPGLNPSNGGGKSV